MSNTSLVFQAHHPQTAHCLHDQVIELVGIGAATREGYRLQPVHGLAVGVGLNKRLVTGLLGPARDLIDRLIP